MSAFEELGISPELIRAVEDLGWTLPTPIQAEAVPLILGGGDMMAAAETGSGKTGAFALPVLQVVHEALRLHQHQAGGKAVDKGHRTAVRCEMSLEDRDSVVAVRDGVRVQSRSEHTWGGVRGNVGAFAGAVCYEVTVEDEGLCRLGWSTRAATLDLGTNRHSFGYGGTGKKSHNKNFDDYGEPFSKGDVIGCLLNCTEDYIAFTKNGKELGIAYKVPSYMQGHALFPAISLKNAEVVVNFGDQPFKYPPPTGFTGLAQAPLENTTTADAQLPSTADSQLRCPLCIVLEPTKDLAEQTDKAFTDLRKYLTNPVLSNALFVGGDPGPQIRALKSGVEIVTGTASRIWDFIESGKLPVHKVRFFVLDEADRLATDAPQEIMKIFQSFPKSGTGVDRLQVLMFSATLHSEEVKKLSAKLCQKPLLVDLKGKEHVPETVDHVSVMIDPREDRTWLQSEPATFTDNMHALDPRPSPELTSPECYSEATKRLKQRMLQRLIDTHKMEQCLVFCRTNFDCDNLEKFLNSLGGGGRFRGKMESGKESLYSCTVLAGARSTNERRAALQAFKDGDVRFLICTDVAARGIDIKELPYVINMTLPDKSEDYIHRVGRVGRADTLGLAISLVSAVPEKVWYCTKPGYKPWLQPKPADVKTIDEGGHSVWYNEQQLLKDIEARLHAPVPSLAADLSLPSHITEKLAGEGGKYGQQRGAGASKEVSEHLDAIRQNVETLASLEWEAQTSFLRLKHRWTSLPA